MESLSLYTLNSKMNNIDLTDYLSLSNGGTIRNKVTITSGNQLNFGNNAFIDINGEYLRLSNKKVLLDTGYTDITGTLTIKKINSERGNLVVEGNISENGTELSSKYLQRSGGILTGDLQMNNNKLIFDTSESCNHYIYVTSGGHLFIESDSDIEVDSNLVPNSISTPFLNIMKNSNGATNDATNTALKFYKDLYGGNDSSYIVDNTNNLCISSNNIHVNDGTDSYLSFYKENGCSYIADYTGNLCISSGNVYIGSSGSSTTIEGESVELIGGNDGGIQLKRLGNKTASIDLTHDSEGDNIININENVSLNGNLNINVSNNIYSDYYKGSTYPLNHIDLNRDIDGSDENILLHSEQKLNLEGKDVQINGSSMPFRTHIVIAAQNTANEFKKFANYTCNFNFNTDSSNINNASINNTNEILQNAINALEEGGTIELLDGHYYLRHTGISDDGILIEKQNITIKGTGFKTVIHQPTDTGEAQTIFTITGNGVTLKNMQLQDGGDKNKVNSPVEIIRQQAESITYDKLFFIFNSDETTKTGACIRGYKIDSTDNNDKGGRFTRIQNCRVFKGFRDSDLSVPMTIPMFDFSNCTGFTGIVGANISSGYDNISIALAGEDQKNNTAFYGHTNIDIY